MLKKDLLNFIIIYFRSLMWREKKLGEEIHEQCAMLSVPLNWSRNNRF
jgi:hypothetical protein